MAYLWNKGFENDGTMIGAGWYDPRGPRSDISSDPYNLGAGATDQQKTEAGYKALWDETSGTSAQRFNQAIESAGVGFFEFGQWAGSQGLISQADFESSPHYARSMEMAKKSGFTQLGQLGLSIGAGLMLGGAASAAFGAATGAAGGTAGASGAGAPLYSTPASIGSTVSTPAMTTLAGPTGTSLLSTGVQTSTLSAGLAAGGIAGTGVEWADSAAASSRIAAPASVASGLSGTNLLLAAQAAPLLMGLAAGSPEMPSAAGAASMDMGRKPENPATANKERAMELRRAAAERAASAAGAKRFKNEADLLGQTGRTTERRRAGQQRVVLGY